MSVAYNGSEGGRLWEGRTSEERGYILGGRGRFWEGGIDSGSITYSCRKGGIFWKEGVDYGTVAHSFQKGVSILRGRNSSRFWEVRI